MTKEELAEEYVNSKGFGSDYNNIDSNEANEEIRKAYLNGLTKGWKERWHDLRKNPDDLPDRMGINSKEVYVAYSDNNCTDFASYNFNTKSWERSEDDSVATIVIAWCELPKFEG